MELRGLYFPQIGGKINPGLHPTGLEDRLPKDEFARSNIFHARAFHVARENKVTFMSQTQTDELKKHEEERDFFCVVRDAFRVFARRASVMLGSAWAFVGALFIIIVWALTGPTFHFSDTWQLIINTGTTIVTFLMVFLIQNTQNRDAKAMHLKLDEIIRALKKARNELVDLENLSDEEMNKLEEQFRRLRTKAEKHGKNMRQVEPEAFEPSR
jgi:low affinity Fe/Cu permease